MNAATSNPDVSWLDRAERYFASPVATSVDELVALREYAQALMRNSRRRVHVTNAGGAASPILGRGLDFAEVRSYQPGDDVRMIDWNVTARTGNAHTKLFVEERERPFFLVVDWRPGMRFATQRMFKSVLASRVSAILGWAATAGNDRVGGMVFADRKHWEVRPQPGRRGLMGLFRAIEQAQQHQPAAQRDNEDREQLNSRQFARQLSRLRHLAPTGSSICILSDFSGFDQAAESALGPLLQRCDVLAAMINDPLDLNLPPSGQYAIASDTARLGLNLGAKKTHEDYASLYSLQREAIKRYFSRRRGRFVPVQTSDDFSNVATRLLQQTSAQG